MSHPSEYLSKFQELMSDLNFLRYYISAKNGWNPYDDSIKKIPSIYWIMAYHVNRMNDYTDNETKIKPAAEFIASIVAPENFSAYRKWEDSQKDKNSGKTTKTKRGESGEGHSDVHFIPGKGLVDENGKVVISEKMLQKSSVSSDGIFAG